MSAAHILEIACAADESYAPHCAAMLVSLLHYNPSTTVHFLHAPGMDEEILSRLDKLVCEHGGRFTSHVIPDEWIAGLPRIRKIPPLMWYRVFLPELLPKNDKILYLDSDILIADNLSQLNLIDLTKYYVAAVDNVLESEVENWPSELGIPTEQGYFNSGVLLLNLALLRADNICERVLEVGRCSNIRLKWPDQDALNKVLGQKRVRLHPRWNCQNSLFYYSKAKKHFGDNAVKEATRKPAVIHFEGGIKPWHYLSKHPFRKIYFKYRHQTPWPDIKLEGETWFNVMIKPMPTTWTIFVLKIAQRLHARWKRLWR